MTDYFKDIPAPPFEPGCSVCETLKSWGLLSDRHDVACVFWGLGAISGAAYAGPNKNKVFVCGPHDKMIARFMEETSRAILECENPGDHDPSRLFPAPPRS